VRHHLDHNATTPVDPRVLERFLAVERECPGNPGSLHTSGRAARACVEAARQQVAAALGRPATDVLFVAGGTEANNVAVLGSGDPALPILLSECEHPSVMEPARARGSVSWPVDGTGAVRVADPDRPVGLVCLVHGQNEVGTLQPVAAAGELARKLSVPLHVDAAQTLGRVPLGPVLDQATTLALSLHKAGGLRGSGVLIARGGGTGLRPLLLGGGQERGLRPGTVSPALAAASALAIELACREQEVRAVAMARARAAFLDALRQVRHEVLTPLASSLPNTLMLCFPGVDGRTLLPALDLAGVEASQGSACSSGSPMPPRVLLAMGLDSARARACVRFSFAASHDPDEARAAGLLVARAIARLPVRAT
jgi:cysteine desulfurase